jgi:hypothetical protein
LYVIHTEAHPLAGQDVKIAEGVADPRGMVVPGALYRIEDYWDRVSGGSWMWAQGNPSALQYAMRTGLVNQSVPTDDEVLYGKIDGIGHLVHVSEIEVPS